MFLSGYGPSVGKGEYSLFKIDNHDFKAVLEKYTGKKLPLNQPSKTTTSKVSSRKHSTKLKNAFKVRIYFLAKNRQCESVKLIEDFENSLDSLAMAKYKKRLDQVLRIKPLIWIILKKWQPCCDVTKSLAFMQAPKTF